MTNMEQSSVSEMVAAARKGSEEAYELLVTAYGPKLMGYFYRNTGSRSEAEDLLQETFLRLVRGLKKYKEKERFDVWLFRLSHNLLIDYWRKRKMIRAGDVSGDDGENWLMESRLGDSADDPVAVLAAIEAKDELQAGLARLSPEQRETILLRYFSGLSFEEIAKTGGVPLGTALARVHRGLKQLKQLMANEEGVSNER
jgi:RNA polymerase sigma-70 factor (ECF subfamily)